MAKNAAARTAEPAAAGTDAGEAEPTAAAQAPWEKGSPPGEEKAETGDWAAPPTARTAAQAAIDAGATTKKAKPEHPGKPHPKPSASTKNPDGSRVTYSSLAAASGIDDPNKIYPGGKIKLPGGGEYTVKKGDTLSKIAQDVRLGNIGAPVKPIPPVQGPTLGQEVPLKKDDTGATLGQEVPLKKDDSGPTRGQEVPLDSPKTGSSYDDAQHEPGPVVSGSPRGTGDPYDDLGHRDSWHKYISKKGYKMEPEMQDKLNRSYMEPTRKQGKEVVKGPMQYPPSNAPDFRPHQRKVNKWNSDILNQVPGSAGKKERGWEPTPTPTPTKKQKPTVNPNFMVNSRSGTTRLKYLAGIKGKK